MSVVSVYAVFANGEEAEAIARKVVEERLAACANLLGACRSIYIWEEEIHESDEVAAIFKTTAARADALIGRICELHSYDVPCVALWPVAKVLASYGDWVEGSLG